MRLDKLTLCGFKSFADPTEIHFSAPLVGIVGPNGCGKSNVVDAIKWVLGEQSAKSLRGGAMMDVIFNGSTSRKPAGMAAVTLHFDNSADDDGERILPLESDQVAVTRRLYRDGTSEYLVNDRKARLRDIRSLFYDTGIGAHGYCIIEQGKVDAMLLSNPVERRSIFEEAAGISKFKAQKKEAGRKLERTEQNLLRCRDKHEEVQRRLRSVKIQATRARNFQQYTARLRELRLEYALAEYHKLQARLQELVDQLEQQEGHRRQAVAQLTSTEDQRQAAEVERQQILAEQRRLEQEHLQHEARREQAEQRRQFAATALDEAEGQVSKENDQHRELAERAEGLVRQLTEHQQVLDDLNRQASESDEQIEQAQSDHRGRQHELNELQSRLEDEKAGIVNLLRRTTEAHNQINALQMQEQNLQGHRDRLTNRADELATELARFLGDRDQIAHQVTEATGLIDSEKLRLEEQKTAGGDLTEAHRRLAEKLSSAKERRSALDSRRAVLQELEESQTGMDEAVRTLLARRASTGEFGFVKGMLAEMISTDTRHAALVEAALGHDQQLLVVDRLADLQAHEAELQSLGGRVSFIALDQLPPLRQDPESTTRLPRAADFLEYDPAVSRLVWYLLGRTLVTDDLSTARELRRRLPRGYRFITTGGQVLEADGRLVVGPPVESAGPGLISRRSELAELDRDLQQINQDIDADQTHLQRLSDRAAHVERTQQELRQAIYEASTLKVELGARLEQMLDSIQRISSEQPVIAGEVKQVHRQLSEAVTERNNHEQDAEKLAADSDASRRRAESLQREIDRKQAEVDEAAEAVTAARVAAGKLTEQLASARKQHGQIDLAGQEAERHRAQLATRIEDLQQRMVQLRTNHQQAEGEIKEADVAAAQASEQLEGFESRLGEISANLGRLAESVSEHRAEAQRLDQQMHEGQVSRRELEVRCDGLRERAAEQLSLDLAEAYRDYQEQEIDWETVETEIEELKTRIGRLGNVNLDAIGELQELEDREQELGEQIQDVDHARRELEHLIRYLNDESRTRFQQTFEQIREHFAGSGGLFRRLFGGGRADLVLLADENGDTDWLESGVDIIAKPPGKEPQSIRLLSGGERTMVAVALLMSIFRSRPSPFCILDEVDAALDEANVDRFTQVVRSFLDHSHFIIITHHKRTMQTADLLYGITMPIRGVSKQVTVKFDHVGQGGKLSAEVLAQAQAEATATPAGPTTAATPPGPKAAPTPPGPKAAPTPSGPKAAATPSGPKAAQLAKLASQASPATIEADDPGQPTTAEMPPQHTPSAAD